MAHQVIVHRQTNNNKNRIHKSHKIEPDQSGGEYYSEVSNHKIPTHREDEVDIAQCTVPMLSLYLSTQSPPFPTTSRYGDWDSTAEDKTR